MKQKKTVNPELASAIANIMKSGELKTLADLSELIKQLSSSFIESALQGELDAHLGYERSSQEKKETTDRRNGTYTKILKSSVGPLTVDIPRDRDGSFEPMLVPKGCSSINGLEEKIIALYADGMSQADISATIKDMYDVDLSQSTISAITDKVIPVKQNPAWESAGIYADDGISGTNTKNRVEFNRLIDDCMAGKIDMVITKSISRFARNTLDYLKYIRQLKEKKHSGLF